MGKEPALRTDIPPGTLHLLILSSLDRLGSMHGYGIALHIEQTSGDVLRVEEGSLYPALQRMLLKGWIKGEWRQTENNRRARYYALTPRGRRQLGVETSEFAAAVRAVSRVIQPA